MKKTIIATILLLLLYSMGFGYCPECFRVANVNVFFKTGEIITGYISVNQKFILSDIGQDELFDNITANSDLMQIFKKEGNQYPESFYLSKKIYEVPEVGKVFAYDESKLITTNNIEKIVLNNWMAIGDGTNTTSTISMISKEVISTSQQMSQKGLNPILLDFNIERLFFVPRTNKIKYGDLKYFINYWCKYRIPDLWSILSQPYSDLKDCEKQIAEVEANILNSIKQINTYLDIKPKISNSLIKETVERRIAVFQEAKDFYIALYDYWKFNNVKKLLFHIKKIKHNALNYEQDLLASDVVGCKKMEVIQKIGNDLNLRTRFGTDYEDFIKVKDIFVKQNYIYIIDRSGRD